MKGFHRKAVHGKIPGLAVPGHEFEGVILAILDINVGRRRGLV
jgi:hypothetical protein